MSDYISLEELKKLTPDQLHDRWASTQFPFELAKCGACITMHSFPNGKFCGHRVYASNPPEIESEVPIVDHFDITVKRDV